MKKRRCLESCRVITIWGDKCSRGPEEAEGPWSLGQALHPKKTVGVREGILGQGGEEVRESTAMAKDQAAQRGQI